MSQGAAASFRHEFISLAGVVERNVYLVKRYIWWDLAFFVWTVANTLTIVFIGKGDVGQARLVSDGQIPAAANQLLNANYVCVYVDTDTAAGKSLAVRGPSVAVTAYAAELTPKVLHAGFQAHLQKPVDPDTLVKAVAALALQAKQ